MSQLKYSVAILVAALCLVTGQDLASLPACGRTCLTDMMEGQAAALGCAADASACLCANPNFHNGINDCANQNCGADVAPTVTNYVVALCATATVAPATPAPTSNPAAPETTAAPTPAPSPTPTTEAPATSTPPTEAASTTPASSAAAAESPSASPTVSSEPSSSPTPVQSPQSSTTLVTNAAATSAPSTTRTTSSPSSTTSSSTTNASATAAADANSSSSSSASKLSLGAIIGICVGAAVVVLATILLFMLRRHHVRMHKRKSVAFMNQLKISDPMPGSGRSYAEAYHSPRYPDEPASELEMRSRRYEDMIPRVAPRLIS